MRRLLFLALFLVPALVTAQDSPEAKEKPEKATEKAPEPTLHRHPTLLHMLRRSNLIRRNVGLRPHKINPILCKAAQDHANYMAATGDFSHYTNGGYQYRAQKYGFKGGVQENIAAGFGTVDATFNTWQSSGGHYAAIVGGYSEAGFGYAISQNGGTYWVGVYGNPAIGDTIGEDEGFAEKLAKGEAVEPEKPLVVEPAKPAPTAPAPATEAAPAKPTPQTFTTHRRLRIFRKR